MNSLIETYNREKLFSARIKKNDIDKSGNIYQHVLLEQLEKALQSPIKRIELNKNISAKRSSCVYKVDIFGSANLGDKVYIKVKIEEYNKNKMVFNLKYLKEDNSLGQEDKLICSASFSYILKENNYSELNA